ncbi:hypothetical protein PHMEG_00020759, partial [Phytophthora megakarya]
MNYHPAGKRVLALLLLLKTSYTQLVGRPIHVYTRVLTLEWVHISKSLFGRTTQFAVMLSPWHLVVNRVKEKDCAFAQLLQAGLTSFCGFGGVVGDGYTTQKGIGYCPHGSSVAIRSFVVSFDGSAKTEKYGGYGSCSWIVLRLPDWTIVTAASAYLETTTVNMAEYSGMNNGVQAALDIGPTDLVIVDDSRLAIQQSLGVIACKKESLMTQLNCHRERVARQSQSKYNASADSLATEALENKVSNVISDEPRLAELRSLNRIQEVIYAPITEPSVDEPSISASSNATFEAHETVTTIRNRPGAESKTFLRFYATQREEANGVPTEDSAHPETELSRVTVPNGDTSVSPNAEGVDPLTVQRERRRRIATAEDEELRWANLKTVLRGEESTLAYRPARDAWKISDHFILSEYKAHYHMGTRPLRSDQQQEDAMIRINEGAPNL